MAIQLSQYHTCKPISHTLESAQQGVPLDEVGRRGADGESAPPPAHGMDRALHATTFLCKLGLTVQIQKIVIAEGQTVPKFKLCNPTVRTLFMLI